MRAFLLCVLPPSSPLTVSPRALHSGVLGGSRAQDDKRGKSEPRGWMYLGDITSVSNEGDIIVIEHPTRYRARGGHRRQRCREDAGT